MSAQLAKKLKQVGDLAQQEKYDDARRLCNELITEFRSDPEPFAKLAYVNAREGKYSDAVMDISRAIERKADEPDYFCSRGRYRLAVGQVEEALVDFDAVIQLCARHRNNYYLEPSQFFKADSLIRLGRVDEALSVLEGVSDEFETWGDGLTSKRDLWQRGLAARGARKGT